MVVEEQACKSWTRQLNSNHNLDRPNDASTEPLSPRYFILSFYRILRQAKSIGRVSNSGSAMLQELSHMDRITQLQDEIQQV